MFFCEIEEIDMKLETERLLLRRWEESDAENLFEYAKFIFERTKGVQNDVY